MAVGWHDREAIPPSDTLRDRLATRDWRSDLLLDPRALLAALGGELDADSTLNAYLLAVALQQVVDDTIEPQSPLSRIGDYVRSTGMPGAAAASTGFAGLGIAATVGHAALPSASRLRRFRASITALVDERAAALVTPGGPPPSPETWRRVEVAAPEVLRHLADRTPVLPSCFETFDLSIDDVLALGARLGDHLGLPQDPVRTRDAEVIVVVGIRTSGSYLAPLFAQVLRNRGADVAVMTMRPGVALTPHSAAAIRRHAKAGARFVVTDDPPVTGTSFVRCIHHLERLGVTATSFTVSFPRFIDTPAVLRRLEALPHVTLDWPDWTVHHHLRADSVRTALQELLASDATVQAVGAVHERRPRRAEAHLRAVFDVTVTVADKEPTTSKVAVQGVGLGYYGEHVVAVADALPEFGPQIHGLRNGLLYRQWLPEATGVSTAALPDDALVDGLARYAGARHERLGVERDASRGLKGSQPVWETAAAEISRAFGRAWPIAQVAAGNTLARAILTVPRPAVIDGTSELENWFVDGDGALRTVGLQGRAYWHHGLSSYDPAFDLAGASDAALDVHRSAELLERYAAITGDEVSPERWLLLRLAQLWGRRRRSPESAEATRSASSRELLRYFAQVVPVDAGATDIATTSLVALDLDGVLESECLGFHAPTMSSAFALRALRRHGHEPILATGRSLVDVKERCSAFGLVGGVAEYGSVIHLAQGGLDVDLRSDFERHRVDVLRRALSALPGVALDPRFNHAVRARTSTGPLDAGQLAALAPAMEGMRAIPGDGQTDFVAAGIDKGTGLDALLRYLVEDRDGAELSFAVGDTESDRPMLERAQRSAVPAHATITEGAWTRCSRPYQAGLLEAVDRFVGHRTRTGHDQTRLARFGCEVCRVPDVPAPRESLLLLLSAAESGATGMVRRGLRAVRLSRVSRVSRVSRFSR